MSLFDNNAMLEATHTEEIDTKFHLCPETECMGQISELRLREGTSTKVPVTWANLDVIWEINDDAIKAQMNMDKIQVRQEVFMDLVTNGAGQIVVPARFDWSTNRNMGIKRIMEATGVKTVGFSLNQLKYQSAWLQIKHEIMQDKNGHPLTNTDGTPAKKAVVARVAPLSAARR